MTDPVTVAREVLDDYECMDDWNKPRTRSGKEVPPSRVTLARAVIRVEALADRLDHEAAYEASRGDTWDAVCIRSEARRLRAALNGETNE